MVGETAGDPRDGTPGPPATHLDLFGLVDGGLVSHHSLTRAV